jgi:Ca2+/H+ antiporter, TMEM165/GDT1 family
VTSDTTFGAAVLLAFWAVLVAELVGDKSMYALASLGLRFRWAVVFGAFTAANSIKMIIAILLGSVVIRFQSHWAYLISAMAFFVSAILIWADESPEMGQERAQQGGWPKGALLCFTSFFLPEWGDPGQIAAAALVLKSHLPVAIWLGAMLALMTKGAAALALGLQIRNRLPQKTLRVVASASCCLLALLAISESMVA